MILTIATLVRCFGVHFSSLTTFFHQNHSDVPEADGDWPTLDSIIEFRDRVRARLMRLYEDLRIGKRKLTRNIARTLVMTLEHEGWHVEVLSFIKHCYTRA